MNALQGDFLTYPPVNFGYVKNHAEKVKVPNWTPQKMAMFKSLNKITYSILFFFKKKVRVLDFSKEFEHSHFYGCPVECCRGPFFVKQPKGNQARCLLPLYVPF